MYWEKSFLSFHVNYPEKTASLKKKISERVGLPVESQILVFQSKKLKDNEELAFSELSVLSLISSQNDDIANENQEKKKKKQLFKKLSSGNHKKSF